MSKILIITKCTECNHGEWIMGKPRCTHPDMKLDEPGIDDDGLLFPRCYTDGTQDILEDCPLEDELEFGDVEYNDP